MPILPPSSLLPTSKHMGRKGKILLGVVKCGSFYSSLGPQIGDKGRKQKEMGEVKPKRWFSGLKVLAHGHKVKTSGGITCTEMVRTVPKKGLEKAQWLGTFSEPVQGPEHTPDATHVLRRL